MFRGYSYRLYPTASQAETLSQWVGATRFVYNLCLEQRRDYWRQYLRQFGKHLTWAQQSREVSQLRAEVDWLAAVPRDPLEQAIRDLDKAYVGFFAGRSGYPSPRRRGLNDALRFQGKTVAVRRLNAKWSEVRLPNAGWVKFRDTRVRRGELKNLNLFLKAGEWSVSFTHAIELEPASAAGASVGIDRGVAQTLTFSTGETIQAPSTSRLLAQQKRAQRVLARRRRGSKRYARQRAKVARLSARMARIRSDWSHRTSTDIARRFGFVAIEALKIQNMTASAAGTVEAPGRNVRQKAGLNRSILEQCWGSFARNLNYKLAERGGVLVAVPPAYTSQTCSACGVIDARSRKSQAVFECVHCDHADNADVNAAKEILRRSTSGLDVEGCRWAA